MPIEFSGDWNGYEQRWSKRGRKLYSVITEAAEITSELMADSIRQRILTMPNRTKDDGRVKFGKMIGSVRSDIKKGVTSVTATAGWTKGHPYYLTYQEDGTDFIEAMFSIDQAQRAGERYAEEALRYAIRKAFE